MTTRTASISEVTVTCDMEADLAYACIGPRFTDAYSEASATAQFDRDASDEAIDAAVELMERLDAEQDALADTAGAAWAAAAVRIGAGMGYEVDAVVTTDDSVLRTAQTRTCKGEPLDRDDDCDGTDEQAIWQAAHDAVAVYADEAGAWTAAAR